MPEWVRLSDRLGRTAATAWIVNAIRRHWILEQFLHGTNRAPDQLAAAIGADVKEAIGCTYGAERALKSAYPCIC